MKPIKFPTRNIGRLEASLCDNPDTDGQCFQLMSRAGTGVWFFDSELPALRAALDEYEAAAREAKLLTAGDIKPGCYFRLRSDPNGVARRKLMPGEYRRFPDATIPDSEPVVRLEVTIEVVE